MPNIGFRDAGIHGAWRNDAIEAAGISLSLGRGLPMFVAVTLVLTFGAEGRSPHRAASVDGAAISAAELRKRKRTHSYLALAWSADAVQEDADQRGGSMRGNVFLAGSAPSLFRASAAEA